jgi:hypothetical protein
MLSVTVTVNNCSALRRMFDQKLGHALAMNAWRDGWEWQQQKVNLILKDYSSKSSVKCVTNGWVCYWVICEPVCNSRPNLVAFLINYHAVSINYPRFITRRPTSQWKEYACGPKFEKWWESWSTFIFVFVSSVYDMNICTCTKSKWHVLHPWLMSNGGSMKYK